MLRGPFVFRASSLFLRLPSAAVAGALERPLGVIEALTSVRDQCPHAAVREHAERAIEAIRNGGSDTLREQAFLVLSTIGGWRGDKAFAVKHALRSFLDAG